MTPQRLPIDGPNLIAPLTSLRERKTLHKLHMDSPGLLSLISYIHEMMGMCFISYYAQFCSESVSWSQCLQCFVAAFLLWEWREGYKVR